MREGVRAVMPRPYEIEIETYAVAEPGPGQVLIENEASAISSGTELAVYTGVHQWLNDPTRTWPRFPFCPGYSGVGRVAALGAGVQDLAVGDRVIYEGRHESYGMLDLNGQPLVARIGDGVPPQIAAFATLARFPLTSLVQSGQIIGR